ncbi:hypothetical protein PR001_g26541 [Phytophthora rubi]|uniref:Uncharacterized protein n=1 Tax=Phytophthora rubi TaxID=129364 RepID=A0A6A3HV92_9STRA|nr:hypothetical protein PR001_g26541 [Phytophthora rubi]KAE9014588.1 hypothetical protein PR002_g14188 [Phytophthora rubi]
MDLHKHLDNRVPVAEAVRGCPKRRKGEGGQQHHEGSVQEYDDLLQEQEQPRHLLFSAGDEHDLEVHRNDLERTRGLRETFQLQGPHHHERQPSAIDAFDDRLQGVGYDLNYADYNMGGSYTLGPDFDVRVEGDGSYGSRVVRRGGFVALLLSAYDPSEMDQLDDSSHVQVNADDDRENDSCGESSGGEELCGDELRDDARSEDVLSGDEELCGDELRDDARSDDVLSGDERSGDELRDDVRSEDMLSGDERSGDELSSDEQFRDEQVGDGQDEHSDSHSWSSGRDLPLQYEQHLIEAAEKILRQTPKNSIDILVLYRRLLRYRRLRMLPRAVACALAMQMREEQKEILRSDIRFNINRLSEKDCIDRFRFGKVQLAYLLMQFRIPPFFSTEEGYRVSSIEALCITFERMGYPSRWRE